MHQGGFYSSVPWQLELSPGIAKQMKPILEDKDGWKRARNLLFALRAEWCVSVRTVAFPSFPSTASQLRDKLLLNASGSLLAAVRVPEDVDNGELWKKFGRGLAHSMSRVESASGL